MYPFSFVLGNKTYQIADELELALVFELLHNETSTSSTLHWNIIMQLDEKLLSIITSYSGLQGCLKRLNTKNQFLLLLKIGDILPKIIQTSEHLAFLLAGIPNAEQKNHIIKYIRRRGLAQMVRSVQDIANILEWLFGENEVLLLETFGLQEIKPFIFTAHDMNTLLLYLNLQNKDFLLDSLSLPFVRALVRNARDFTEIFSCLTAAKADEFLRLFPQEQLCMLFGNDAVFHECLFKISDSRQQILLSYLQA